MKKTKIVSAFPACGKSYIFDNMKSIDCVDSDSSQFSWILDEHGKSTGMRNPDFPNNYKGHIDSLVGKVDFIFVSSHKEVRDMLTESGYNWISVMPHRDMKNEWIGRCFVRGSGEEFCKMLQENWELWVPEQHNMSTIPGACGWVTLLHNKHLSDSMVFIETLPYNEKYVDLNQD